MAKAPPADPGMICPLHKRDVSKVCHKCPWYVSLRMTNPNTGKDIDEWGCAIAWGPVLAVEVSQKTNSVGRAVESFRNEMKKDNSIMLAMEEQRLKIGNRPG